MSEPVRRLLRDGRRLVLGFFFLAAAHGCVADDRDASARSDTKSNPTVTAQAGGDVKTEIEAPVTTQTRTTNGISGRELFGMVAIAAGGLVAVLWILKRKRTARAKASKLAAEALK